MWYIQLFKGPAILISPQQRTATWTCELKQTLSLPSLSFFFLQNILSQQQKWSKGGHYREPMLLCHTSPPSNLGFTFLPCTLVAGTVGSLAYGCFPLCPFLLSVGEKTRFLFSKLLLQLKYGHIFPRDSGKNYLS